MLITLQLTPVLNNMDFLLREVENKGQELEAAENLIRLGQ
jgi:hypothetical protein